MATIASNIFSLNFTTSCSWGHLHIGSFYDGNPFFLSFANFICLNFNTYASCYRNIAITIVYETTILNRADSMIVWIIMQLWPKYYVSLRDDICFYHSYRTISFFFFGKYNFFAVLLKLKITVTEHTIIQWLWMAFLKYILEAITRASVDLLGLQRSSHKHHKSHSWARNFTFQVCNRSARRMLRNYWTLPNLTNSRWGKFGCTAGSYKWIVMNM